MFVSQWPSWQQSAAGARSWEMLKRLAASCDGVTCVSPARINSPLAERLEKDLGVRLMQCLPNEKSAASQVVADSLRDVEEAIAIFDRFYIEEMFGHIVASNVPHALRVLDTQDLHFLREARRRAVALGASLDEVCDVDWMLQSYHIADDSTYRELASIHRSDVVLVTSPIERQLLVDHCAVAATKLALAPLFYDNDEDLHGAARQFESRRHLCMLGNFRHAPNVDAVAQLRDVIWPALANKLPKDVELHCYGAYATNEHLRMSRGSFKVRGAVLDQFEALSRFRVLVAPLRFGAGLKGKIADAWRSRCAVVTTGIGVEGMTDRAGCFAGLWSNDLENKFVALTVAAYTDEVLWTKCVRAGRRSLADLYDARENLDTLINRLRSDPAALDASRRADWISRVLWTQAFRATEYMSRYIELKADYRRLQQDARAWGGSPESDTRE